MRVISGKAKGHKLKAPKGDRVRPTEDRIKESLFNILGHIKSDALVLDAFGGTGSIGIEFLSRGADKAYFIDRHYASISIIKENLNHTKLIDSAKIIKSDIFIALDRLGKNKVKFDYIYLDPPFNDYELLNKTVKYIDKDDILDIDGILIVEHEKNLILDDLMYGFKKIDHRDYGSKIIDIYKNDIEEAPYESSLSR